MHGGRLVGVVVALGGTGCAAERPVVASAGEWYHEVDQICAALVGRLQKGWWPPGPGGDPEAERRRFGGFVSLRVELAREVRGSADGVRVAEGFPRGVRDEFFTATRNFVEAGERFRDALLSGPSESPGEAVLMGVVDQCRTELTELAGRRGTPACARLL